MHENLPYSTFFLATVCKRGTVQPTPATPPKKKASITMHQKTPPNRNILGRLCSHTWAMLFVTCNNHTYTDVIPLRGHNHTHQTQKVVSKNTGLQNRPQIVGLFLQAHPLKGPPITKTAKTQPQLTLELQKLRARSMDANRMPHIHRHSPLSQVAHASECRMLHLRTLEQDPHCLEIPTCMPGCSCMSPALSIPRLFTCSSFWVAVRDSSYTTIRWICIYIYYLHQRV